MFYRPEQSGWNKTMACRHYCSELNPDTTFEVHNMNVAAEESQAKFKETLQSGSIDRKQGVNMIVGCVDNMEARLLMEQMGGDLQIPYIDAVVADDAMSGCVQLIIPGRTGGLEASPIKSHMDKRPGSCPASLPTTDSIIAGTGTMERHGGCGTMAAAQWLRHHGWPMPRVSTRTRPYSPHLTRPVLRT